MQRPTVSETPKDLFCSGIAICAGRRVTIKSSDAMRDRHDASGLGWPVAALPCGRRTDPPHHQATFSGCPVHLFAIRPARSSACRRGRPDPWSRTQPPCAGRHPCSMAGLALTSASISAARLPCSLSLSNERRPIVPWMIPGLVDAELDLASLGVACTAVGNVGRHGADLRVRHQAARDRGSDRAYRRRAWRPARSDHDVEVPYRPPLISWQPGRPCRRCRRRRPWLLQPWHPWANTATRLVLPVPLGITHGATHHLVRLLGIDAQLHGHVDRFVELGGGGIP